MQEQLSCPLFQYMKSSKKKSCLSAYNCEMEQVFHTSLWNTHSTVKNEKADVIEMS